MSLPLFDAASLPGPALLGALRQHGGVLLKAPAVPPPLAAAVLAEARAFFAGSDADKQRLAERQEPPFRGYSRQHGARDCREQVHFGPERPPGKGAPYLALQGPNRWPAGPFAAVLRDYQAAVTELGATVLGALAAALGHDVRAWLGADPYYLLKVIAYPDTAGAVRPGVAAHLDWSLVTLTLQDDVGGLAVLDAAGAWVPVPPVPGTLVLHVGELLAYATGGALSATPHRVVNASGGRTRLSLPLFVNPSLDTVLVAGAGHVPPPRTAEHVHAVLPPGPVPAHLAFGPSEWARKAGRQWCHACCGSAATPGPASG